MNSSSFKLVLSRIVAAERDVLSTLRYNIMPMVATSMIPAVAETVVRNSEARLAVRGAKRSIQCLEPLASRVALEMYYTTLGLTHTATELAHAAIHVVFLQLGSRLPAGVLPPTRHPAQVALACKDFL